MAIKHVMLPLTGTDNHAGAASPRAMRFGVVAGFVLHHSCVALPVAHLRLAR